jgi:hypothetical protein
VSHIKYDDLSVSPAFPMIKCETEVSSVFICCYVIIGLDSAVMVCHTVFILQVNVDFINSVPNSNSKNKEVDPLLITFQDIQEKNEVRIYVQLSIFRSDVRECI